MSNALCTTEQHCRFNVPPALASQELINGYMLTLFAVGLCVLAVWIFRRVISPDKLRLQNSPGRNFRLDGGIVLMLAIMVFFAQIMIGGLASLLLGGVFPDGSAELLALPDSIARVAAIAAMLIIARCVFSLGIIRGLGLSLRHWVFDSIRAVIAYLAYIPVCLLLFLMVAPFFSEDQTHDMLKAMHGASTPGLMLLILSSVVLAPISEEILFRGLMQSALRNLTGSAWMGIAITSVVFTAIHAPYYYSMPSLLVLSVVLGYNYERSGRLLSPILIHMIFNGVFVAIEIANINAGG